MVLVLLFKSEDTPFGFETLKIFFETFIHEWHQSGK